MASKQNRKASAPARGLGDILALVMIALAVMLAAAQWSFDPGDLRFFNDPPNETTRNLTGMVGAHFAFGVFFLFGLAAYLVPLLLVLFALAFFMQWLAYLKRRWAWGLILLFCCMGLVEINEGLFQWWLNTTAMDNPGGIIGAFLSRIFSVFGRMGATVVFITLYAISLLYLTNFQLGEWLRNLVVRWRDWRESSASEEKKLQRKARELRKQAEKLQAEAEKIGLGADLQPVPEPMVRDLSVPQARGGRKEKPVEPSEDEPEIEVGEGEVIPAGEITAASTEDVLGRKSADDSDSDSRDYDDEPLPVIRSSAKPKAGKRTKPITVASTPKIGNYKLPGQEHLQHPDTSVKPSESKDELMARAKLMQQTLAQFGIEVSLGDITKGPTITRYELHPAPGVKLEKITGLTNNIAAALKAERIHILAPVPGKSSVGIEVPNRVKTKVIMRDLLESEEWKNTKARIPLALGKDVYGNAIIADLADMPHLLIAGSTGSGKSVCINSIIASLLYRFSPDELRFVMIDPKVVELQQYNALPHLVVPVVTDPKKVVLALRWVVNEMEKRYQIFAKVGVRNVKSFNDRPIKPVEKSPQQELPLTANKEKIEPGEDGFAVEIDEEIVVPRDDEVVIPEKLSYIVVIIDELADLMLVAPADVEMAIARITQMARAAGIHCIVATQRPSVDVITGVIKANIPARIAFQVASKVDSRTILDAMGADKLLGKGDMLYLPPGAARLIRSQGVLITDEEIQGVVDFIAQQGKPSYETEIHEQLKKPVSNMDTSFSGGGGGGSGDEDLLEQCIEVIRTEQKASVSLLQRRLRLGYTRAARLMDELEDRGVVGPSKGAEPRDILLDLDGTGADGGGQKHGV